MAKKYKNIPAQLAEPEAVYPAPQRAASLRPLPSPGPVPVQPVASNVQLTPIVQPVAFVPYSSQKQPLYMYEGEEEVVLEDEDEYIEEAAAFESAPIRVKKKVSALSIFLIITSLLIVAALVIGKFVSAAAEYTLINDKIGYTLAEELIANIKAGNIAVMENVIPAAVILAGIFAVITLVTALFDIMRKGASVFAKIIIFFTFAFAAVAVALSFVNSYEKGYGLYIVAGLALLQLIFSFIAKREKRLK